MQTKRMCGWHDGALNRVDTCVCVSDLSTLTVVQSQGLTVTHSIRTVSPLKFPAVYVCICQVAAVLTLAKGNSG